MTSPVQETTDGDAGRDSHPVTGWPLEAGFLRYETYEVIVRAGEMTSEVGGTSLSRDPGYPSQNG